MLGLGASPLDLLRQSTDSVHAVLDDHKQMRLVQAELAPTLGTTESNHTSKLECDFGRISTIEHTVTHLMGCLANCTRQRSVLLFGDPSSGANCLADLMLRATEEVRVATADSERPVLPDGGTADKIREAEAAASIVALEGVTHVLQRRLQQSQRIKARSLLDKICKRIVRPPAGTFDPRSGKLVDPTLASEAITRWDTLRRGDPGGHSSYQPFVLPREGGGTWRAPLKIRYGTRYHVVADYCTAAEVERVLHHWSIGPQRDKNQPNQMFLQRLHDCAKYGPTSKQFLGHFNRPPAAPAAKKPRVARTATCADWWYRDHSGYMQGPFTRLQMHQWLHEGYFNMGTLVHCTSWPHGCKCGPPPLSSLRTIGLVSGGVKASAFVTSVPGRVLPELLHAMTSPASSPRPCTPKSLSLLPGMEVYNPHEPSSKPPTPTATPKSARKSQKRKRAETAEGSAVAADELDSLLDSSRVFCGGMLDQTSDRIWAQGKLEELLGEAEDGSRWDPNPNPNPNGRQQVGSDVPEAAGAIRAR